MSDLVKRLRDWNGNPPRHMHEIVDLACTRIEQLERELSEAKGTASIRNDELDGFEIMFKELRAQLAAEKALADTLDHALGLMRIHTPGRRPTGTMLTMCDKALAAYRKARGL